MADEKKTPIEISGGAFYAMRAMANVIEHADEDDLARMFDMSAKGTLHYSMPRGIKLAAVRGMGASLLEGFEEIKSLTEAGAINLRWDGAEDTEQAAP